MQLGKYKHIVIAVIILLGILFLFFTIKSAYNDIKTKINYNKLNNGVELSYSNLTINKYLNDKYEIILTNTDGNSFDASSQYYVSALIYKGQIIEVFSKANTSNFDNLAFNNEMKLIFSDYYKFSTEPIKVKLILKPNLTYDSFFNMLINKVDFNSMQENLTTGYVINLNDVFNQYELTENNTFKQVKTNAILNFKCNLINKNFN